VAGQSIRRSQYITTYGPGAILEGPNGPRIIPSLANSTLFDRRPAHDFEITDLRLSTALLNGANIVRVPSNAELGQSDTEEVYNTFPFPSWALCTKHNILYLKSPDAHDRRSCPQCAPHQTDMAAWQRVRQQAIRFIMACPQGHLDDVDWNRVVQHRTPGCRSTFFHWAGGGSALRNITITCPNCNASVNLGSAYAKKWPCSGRHPEHSRDRHGCDAEAQILQRGAANLHMAEIYSALTIPPSDTRLHRLLESPAIQQMLLDVHIESKQDFLDRLQRRVPRYIGQATVDEIARYNEEEILAAIQQTLQADLPSDSQQLRNQEFIALRRAAEHGAPAQPSSTPGAPPQFEVIKNDVRIFDGKYGHSFRVTPVSRLRVVMVQHGYRRLDPVQSEIVSVEYIDNHNRVWYPGVELFGEGIFIDLDPASLIDGFHFPLSHSVSNSEWHQAWFDPERYQQRLYEPTDKDYLHPVFVWWHTLSHRLINALSIDSGYSSAAVRERVYIDVDSETGKAVGGILLYTAQPGGDGTLGGMIALVPHFNRVLQSALHRIDACSNDPLCSDEYFRQGKYNGAACYACQLVSETSCEHRNTRLDRHLLLENLP